MLYNAKQMGIVIKLYDLHHKIFNSSNRGGAVDFFLLFAPCLKACKRNGKSPPDNWC